MQKDMHYYGTYCLARAAAFEKTAATTIATCGTGARPYLLNNDYTDY